MVVIKGSEVNNMHPKFEIPTDPHGKHRYESAMKHVEAAKKAGKSSDACYLQKGNGVQPDGH